MRKCHKHTFLAIPIAESVSLWRNAACELPVFDVCNGNSRPAGRNSVLETSCSGVSRGTSVGDVDVVVLELPLVALVGGRLHETFS